MKLVKVCIAINIMILISSCAVIKGMHQDKLEANKKPAKDSTSQQTPNESSPNLIQSNQTRKANETAAKMLSPVVH